MREPAFKKRERRKGKKHSSAISAWRYIECIECMLQRGK